MYDSFFYCILSLKDSKKDVIWKEVYVNSLYKVYIWKETLDLWSHINEIIRETIYVRICTFFWQITDDFAIWPDEMKYNILGKTS